MAKWGEGDPRWIVEERADAKNVNNWHWSEKNGTQWSKEYIKKALVSLILENDECITEIIEVSKLEGEAIANNRKSKVIVFYEWDLELSWKGKLKSSDNKTEFKGKIMIPNLSEEYSASELDVAVSVEQDSSDATKVKEYLRVEGSKVIRDKLALYIQDLRTDFTKDLILPTKTAAKQPVKNSGTNHVKKSMNETVVSKEKPCVPVSSETSTLEMDEEFFCTPNDLCQVLINKDLVSAFSRSTAIVDAVEGGHFSMFGDSILGQFTEVTPPSRLVMTWRHKSWAAVTFSRVELTFSAVESGTKLHLRQTDIPAAELATTQRGWAQNYFHAIKMTFGYGGRMF